MLKNWLRIKRWVDVCCNKKATRAANIGRYYVYGFILQQLICLALGLRIKIHLCHNDAPVRVIEAGVVGCKLMIGFYSVKVKDDWMRLNMLKVLVQRWCAR